MVETGRHVGVKPGESHEWAIWEDHCRGPSRDWLFMSIPRWVRETCPSRQLDANVSWVINERDCLTLSRSDTPLHGDGEFFNFCRHCPINRRVMRVWLRIAAHADLLLCHPRSSGKSPARGARPPTRKERPTSLPRKKPGWLAARVDKPAACPVPVKSKALACHPSNNGGSRFIA